MKSELKRKPLSKRKQKQPEIREVSLLFDCDCVFYFFVFVLS